jgi:hypothetical protein
LILGSIANSPQDEFFVHSHDELNPVDVTAGIIPAIVATTIRTVTKTAAIKKFASPRHILRRTYVNTMTIEGRGL